MTIYFVGMNMRFIQFVREVVQFQGKEEEVLIIPNSYIGAFDLMRYDPGDRKLIKIDNVKEHTF